MLRKIEAKAERVDVAGRTRIVRKVARLAPIAACVLALATVTATKAIEARKIRPSAPDDEAIVRTVLNRISGRPGLDVSAVSATAQDGSLVLTGRIATIFDRREIERMAAGVQGVVALVDRM